MSRFVDRLSELESRLLGIADTREDHVDQDLGIVVCREALAAAQAGNYGVGAVLTDPKGDIVVTGRNRAFHPEFRSDLHAEMIVMNEFEQKNSDTDNMRGYALLCSLEPCPMCLSRLLISGVETVKYLAEDELGGMVTHIDRLPKAWSRLAERRNFERAEVTDSLRKLALDLFLLNLESCQQKLWSR